MRENDFFFLIPVIALLGLFIGELLTEKQALDEIARNGGGRGSGGTAAYGERTSSRKLEERWLFFLDHFIDGNKMIEIFFLS